MLRVVCRFLVLVAASTVLTQCGSSIGVGNMGGPTQDERSAKIGAEPSGDFFYGRRYYVHKTRFWGYLRKPHESWNRAKLVFFDESQKTNPDRLPENGPDGQRYGFDNNYEYRIHGYFEGKQWYEPNSNQFLPVFKLTGYEVTDRNPGWLFRPDDHYEATQVTLVPR